MSTALYLGFACRAINPLQLLLQRLNKHPPDIHPSSPTRPLAFPPLSHFIAIFMMAKLALSILAVCSALLALGTTATNTDNRQWILVNEISRVSNQSLMWGPYRPNLYFGVKPRIPKSMIAGLMWGKVDDFASVAQSTSFPPCPLFKKTNNRETSSLNLITR